MRVHRFIQKTRFPLLLLILAVGLGCAACSSTEADNDNESVKPWASPEGWQNGNLQMMQQQH